MPENEAESLKQGAVFDRFYFDMAERNVHVQYLGEADVEGLDSEVPPERLHHLRYTYADGDSIDVYFDPSTGLLRMTSRHIQTSIGPTDTLFLVGTGQAMQNLIFSKEGEGSASELTLQKGEQARTGKRIQ